MSETMPDRFSPRQGRRRLVAVITITAVAAVITTVGVIIANTAADGETAPAHGSPMIELVEETLPPDLELADPAAIETYGDPMDLEVMEWQNDLHSMFSGNPNFGAPAISRDGTLFTITWHGEPSDALDQHIAAAPEGLDVIIRSAAFPPGELQTLVVQAMQPGLIRGVEIAMGSVEMDGSGIRFGLASQPVGMTLDDVGRTIADTLGRTDVPVHVDVSGAVIPVAG